MSAEYVVKRGNTSLEAKVLQSRRQVAEIVTEENYSKLTTEDGLEFSLSNHVHGEFRPFSIMVQDSQNKTPPILTIREHVFKHHDRFYMLTNHPAGKSWEDYLHGSKFICRLDNFPFNELNDIDPETRHRLRRFRGVPVGELSGLGTEGHKVKIEKELEDIGLLVAASSYLLYASA